MRQLTSALILLCFVLFPSLSSETHATAHPRAELPPIEIPIRFEMPDRDVTLEVPNVEVPDVEVPNVEAPDEPALDPQQTGYPQPIPPTQQQDPPQRPKSYYLPNAQQQQQQQQLQQMQQQALQGQRGGKFVPMQPYQRACGTMATDICEKPVTIPPGATAEQVYQLANQALGRHQLGEQLAYIRKSAEMGYAPSEYVLGEYYLTHRIAENDWPTKGAYWLGQSAAQGDGAAEVALGIVYEDGSSNVPRNQAQAIPLLKAAAAQHKGLAEFRIGLDYEFGNGLPHNRPLAVQYLRRAAADGVPTAAAKANFLAKGGSGHYQSVGDLDAAMYPAPSPRQLKPGECPPPIQTYLVGPRSQAIIYNWCRQHPGCPYGGGYLHCAS